jgi:hypothetical protein
VYSVDAVCVAGREGEGEGEEKRRKKKRKKRKKKKEKREKRKKKKEKKRKKENPISCSYQQSMRILQNWRPKRQTCLLKEHPDDAFEELVE